MKHKVALTLTAGIMVAAMLPACSSDSGSSDSTKPAGSGGASATAAADVFAKFTRVPEKIVVSTPLSKKPPTGIKVVYLNNGLTQSQQYSSALKEAVKPLGWTAKDLKFDPANPQAAGSAFQTAVNQGYDVIEVQGLDGALYSKYVPDALAKKITIIDTVSSGKKIPGVVYVDRSGPVGKAQADIVTGTILADAKQRKVTAHVLNISSVIYANLLGPYFGSVTSNIKSAGCGACTSDTFNVSAQATISNAFAPSIVSYLQSHQNINYINVPLGAFAIGLLPAIKQAGLDTSIRLIGATPLPDQIEALKKGDKQVLGWVANNIYVGAWEAIDAAARKLVGDDANVYENVPTAKWLLTESSGDGPSGLVPAPVAPADYVDQFKKNWLLK